MNLQRGAVRAAAWTGLQKWSDQVFTLLVFLVLARLLEPESFGIVAYAMALTGFIQVVVRGGMGMAVVQRETLEPEHLDSAFWYSVTVAGVLTAGLTALAEPLAVFLDEPALADILPVLALLLVINALAETQAALLRRALRFRELAIRMMIANTLGGASGVTAAYSGLGMWSLVLQSLVSAAVSVALLWVQSSWRPRLRFSWPHFRELFAFGGVVTVNAVLWAITGRADRLLIGRLLGSPTLGIYAVGSRGLTLITELVGKTLAGVGLPVFSRLQDEPARIRRAYLKALRLNCLGMFPAYCGLAALSPSLVPILFGEGWEGAVPVMQIMAFFGMTQAVQSFAAPIMSAVGRPSWVTVLAASNAVLTVVGVWFAAPYGLAAVAWALTARGVVMIPFVLLGMHWLLGLRWRDLDRAFRVPLLASVVTGALAHFGDMRLEVAVDFPLLRVLGLAGGCALLYVLIIRVLDRDLYDEVWDLVEQLVPARFLPGRSSR